MPSYQDPNLHWWIFDFFLSPRKTMQEDYCTFLVYHKEQPSDKAISKYQDGNLC
jgi:hypothetical protein